MEADKRELWKRREFLGLLGGAGGAVWLLACQRGEAPGAQSTNGAQITKSSEGSNVVYIGGYGAPTALSVASFDPASGALTIQGQVPGVPDASFLAYSVDKKFMYAVNEHEKDGQLTALDISDPKQPKVLNTVSAHGDAPCHISVHPSGRFLFTANYFSATLAVNRIQPDGRIGESTDVVRHTTTRPATEKRPSDAHAHQVLTDPSGTWVLCVDLGADAVYVYRFEQAKGKLIEHKKFALPDGTGPRHLAFHPSGKFAYILGELTPVVTVATWDPAKGTLDLGQRVSTIPSDFKGDNFPGEIAITSDAKYIYVSNRGENSIGIFAVKNDGSSLEFLGTAPTGGNWPRHFALSPDERWMYISNQRSDTVTWLARDAQSGKLSVPKGTLSVPKAAMVLFHT